MSVVRFRPWAPNPSCARPAWFEIDTKRRVWKIPGSRMRSGAEHRVPISAPAMEILKRASELRDGGEYVFPSPMRRNRPLSDVTLAPSSCARPASPTRRRCAGSAPPSATGAPKPAKFKSLCLTAFLKTATGDDIHGRLLDRGAAWSLMREDGVPPPHAPRFGSTIETDLAEHGFALLRGAMALRDKASASTSAPRCLGARWRTPPAETAETAEIPAVQRNLS